MPRRLANRILKLASSAFDRLGSGTFLVRDSADDSIKMVYQEEGDAIADVKLLDSSQRIPSGILPAAGSPPAAHGSTHRVGGSDAEFTHVVDPVSPYPVAANVRRITTSATLIVELPEAGFNNGEILTVINSSDATITVSGDPQGADQLDGGAGTVAINVSAHGVCGFLRRAANDWRSVQLSSADLNGAPRAIYVSVVGGVLGWKEQVLVGNTWTDVSAHTALTVETNGGVTFADTTYIIPGVTINTTAPQSCPDERYVAFASASAALQALIVAGGWYVASMAEDSMEQEANARWGWAMTRTGGGAFDAATENDVSIRKGWTGTQWQVQNATSSGNWTNVSANASTGYVEVVRFLGLANGGAGIHKIGASFDQFSQAGGLGGQMPDRLYITASAQTAPTVLDCDVVNPTVRVAFYPASLF